MSLRKRGATPQCRVMLDGARKSSPCGQFLAVMIYSPRSTGRGIMFAVGRLPPCLLHANCRLLLVPRGVLLGACYRQCIVQFACVRMCCWPSCARSLLTTSCCPSLCRLLPPHCRLLPLAAFAPAASASVVAAAADAVVAAGILRFGARFPPFRMAPCSPSAELALFAQDRTCTKELLAQPTPHRVLARQSLVAPPTKNKLARLTSSPFASREEVLSRLLGRDQRCRLGVGHFQLCLCRHHGHLARRSGGRKRRHWPAPSPLLTSTA